ncbi:class I SAM-dependent methyltransferase [Streptomyces sp. NPDC002004]
MPTLPPERAGSDQPAIRQHQEVAQSFGSDAERYDRARPRYPDALMDRIVDAAPGRDVLDVGCGTGIAARQFRAAGCRVLGVEPDARMAEVARQFGIEVDTATFEAWEPAGREFDAIVAGQAWHWIDPAAGAAKAARALRPGGLLAAFWNAFRLPPDMADAFAAVLRRVMPDSPFALRMAAGQTADGYRELVDGAADGIRKAGGFGEPERWSSTWEWTYTRDAWLDQMPTHGSLTLLPPDKLTEVLEGVGTAIDVMGGSFTMHYTTVLVSAVRADAG